MKKNNFKKPVDSGHDETTMPKPEKSKHLQKNTLKHNYVYDVKHEGTKVFFSKRLSHILTKSHLIFDDLPLLIHIFW